MHTSVKIHHIFWVSTLKEHVGKSEWTRNSGKKQVSGENNKHMPNMHTIIMKNTTGFGTKYFSWNPRRCNKAIHAVSSASHSPSSRFSSNKSETY